MIRRTQDDGTAQMVAADPLALPRDPATDQSNDVVWASLGLEQSPTRPNLGRQFTDPRRFLTRTGSPGRWREGRQIVGTNPPGDRDLPMPSIGAGTINRNIRYPQDGIPVPGLFSWAANGQQAPAGVSAAAIEPSRVDEYYLSSTFLGLADPAPWVVAGYERPQPGLQGFQAQPTIMAQPGTGWPVLAPSIPSYGSRVPLRRPRGLVSA